MTKNLSYLLFLLANRGACNFTTIVKLSYFCDLSSVGSWKSQISDYKYIRYYYWPYNGIIKEDLKRLVADHYVQEIYIPQQNGEEQVLYETTEKILSDKAIFWTLTDEEKLHIANIVSELSWFNASQLWTISYKTKPMLEKGAQQGGKEAWEEELNLNAQ